MKALYLTTVPTPYKVAFFEELGKYCELTVLFENHTVNYREESWMVNEYRNFNAVFLKGPNINGKKISFEVLSYLKKKKYDWIIVGVYSTITQMIAQIYMRVKKIDYILSSDGGMVKKDSIISKSIKKYFISGANYWLSTGNVTTEYLCYYGATKERIYKYPFTSIAYKDVLESPMCKKEKTEIKKSLGISEERIVLSVGQFIYRKGIDVLIRVAAKLPGIGFYIIGGVPTKEYEELKQGVRADNIHFINFMKKEELSQYYKSADVFALATREDIWGLVINEAMAYGLPVVTTDRCVAGVEMVDEGVTGSIVEAENVSEFVKAITYWMEKATFENRSASLDTARQYTIEEMAKVHYEFLEKLTY